MLYLQRDKTVLLGENVWQVFFRRSRPRRGIIFKFPQYLPISTLELSLLARFLFHLWFSSAGVEIYIRVLDCKKLYEKLVHARLISFIPTSTLFSPFCFCSHAQPRCVRSVSFSSCSCSEYHQPSRANRRTKEEQNLPILSKLVEPSPRIYVDSIIPRENVPCFLPEIRITHTTFS